MVLNQFPSYCSSSYILFIFIAIKFRELYIFSAFCQWSLFEISCIDYFSGLQDQLLALVVMQERPDLEEQRQQIVVGTATMKAELKEIEDRILYKLSISEGSPLDDLDFIITLEASKVKSEDIKVGWAECYFEMVLTFHSYLQNKVESAEITQIDIDNTRALYIPVANRAQILFFCLADLSNVDPMYQYSLEWFISIFMNSMSVTEKSSEFLYYY